MNLIKFNQMPVFSGFFRDFENDFFGNSETERGNIPAVNIMEEDKQFVLQMAAPGLKKDDFKINLDNQVLTISKEQKEENNKGENENYMRREFLFNTFSRSFALPETIVFDKIKADYKDGILTVSLPKDEKTIVTRDIKVA